MAAFLSPILRRWFPQCCDAAGIARILLQRQGWWRSRRTGRPEDAQGRPLPWMTYPMLAWLDQLDFTQARIFEYGAGWSTLYWARQAREIAAVEGRAAWVEELRPRLPANATLYGPLDGPEYVQAARPGAPWNVIVIDGQHRLDCARAAADLLQPGGMIILDNSDWFVEAAECLRSRGFTQVDFQGFGPCNAYTWTSSAFFAGPLDLPRLDPPQPGPGSIPYQP